MKENEIIEKKCNHLEMCFYTLNMIVCILSIYTLMGAKVPWLVMYLLVLGSFIILCVLLFKKKDKK